MVRVRAVLAVATVLAAMASGSSASAQLFTINPSDPDFGEGRISARKAKDHIDRSVTACGRGSNVAEAWHALNVGDPGLYGLVGADLMIFFPREASPAFYYGKVICVTGVVKIHDLQRSKVPGITVDSPQQITVLSGMPRPAKK